MANYWWEDCGEISDRPYAQTIKLVKFIHLISNSFSPHAEWISHVSDVNYCYYFYAHFTRRYENHIFKYQTKLRLFHFPKLKKSQQPYVLIIGIIWDLRKCQICIFMWWSHKTGNHVEQRLLRCCRRLLARLAPLPLLWQPDWVNINMSEHLNLSAHRNQVHMSVTL